MSDMNARTTAMMAQIREMRLTPAELEAMHQKYAEPVTATEHVIHAATSLLLLEIAFAK